jgi:hypothetical protein
MEMKGRWRVSEHTPGPWHDNGFTNIDGIYIEQDREPWQTIARVECNTNAQWKANAKLIARAPDLLKEVEQLKTMHGSPGMCCSCRYDQPPYSLVETECHNHKKTRVELTTLRAQRDALVEAASTAEIQCDSASELLREIDNDRGDVWAKEKAEQLLAAADSLRTAITAAKDNT